MKFVIDNEVYYLNFIHTPPVLKYSNKMSYPRKIVVRESGKTTAIMYTFDKFSEKKVLCEQTAFCHPNDKYSKIKGRKESIKKIFNNQKKEVSEAHGGHEKLYFFEFDKILPERSLIRRKVK